MYLLLTLQGWIFATKYFESAIVSTWKNRMLKYVWYIKWCGIVIYSTLILGEFIWSITSFDIACRNNESCDWFNTTNEIINNQTTKIWAPMNVLNTFLSIFSIGLIFRSVSVLQRANENLRFKYVNMSIHAILLVFQLVVIILFAVVNQNSALFYTVWMMMTAADTGV